MTTCCLLSELRQSCPEGQLKDSLDHCVLSSHDGDLPAREILHDYSALFEGFYTHDERGSIMVPGYSVKALIDAAILSYRDTVQTFQARVKELEWQGSSLLDLQVGEGATQQMTREAHTFHTLLHAASQN